MADPKIYSDTPGHGITNQFELLRDTLYSKKEFQSDEFYEAANELNRRDPAAARELLQRSLDEGLNLDRFLEGVKRIKPIKTSLTSQQFLDAGGGDEKEVSFEEFAGKAPPTKTKELASAAFDKTVFGLRAMGGEVAAIADLVLSIPGFMVNVGAQLGGTIQARARGIPFTADQRALNPLTAYGVGREAGHTFSEPLMSPVKKILDLLKSGEAYEKSKTTEGMNWFMEKVEAAGRAIEGVTGGRISRDAMPMFVEVLMASSAGIGSGKKPGIDPAATKRMRESATKMREQAEIEAKAADLTPDEFVSRIPVQQQINDVLGIRTPQEQARVTRQRRQDLQNIGRERALSAEEQAQLDLAEARGVRRYESAGESIFQAEERTSNEAVLRERDARAEAERGGETAVDVDALPKRPERVGQAEVLRIMQKPGFERSAEDLITLRRARQEGGATMDALMLLGAAGIGATVGGLLDDNALRGATLGGATALAPLALLRGLDAGGVRSRMKQSGAVKEPGGMWHPEAVERLSSPLHDKISSGRNRRLDLTMTEEHLRKAYGANEENVQTWKKDKELLAWSDKAIKNYLNKYAGTARDPLKDVEIPFNQGTRSWGDAWDTAIKPRVFEDAGGLSAGDKVLPVRKGETVYEIAEQSVVRGERDVDRRAATASISDYLSHAGDYARQNIKPEDLQKYDLTRLIRETYQNDLKMAKEMEKAQAASTKELPVYKAYPDGYKWVELKLPEKLTEEQGKQVRPLTPEETGREFGYGRDEALELLEGHKSGWFKRFVALGSDGKPVKNAYTGGEAVGKTPEEAWLAGRLAEEGNIMGHCVGGYCEGVASGESRIFSLRDERGRSHVTVEVRPDKVDPEGFFNQADEAFKAKYPKPEMSADVRRRLELAKEWEGVIRNTSEFREFEDLSPPSIDQIKGKQNRAPEAKYLPYVQDFVKSGKWGEVGDLQGTGLVDLQQGIVSPLARNAEMINREGKEFFGDQRFVTREQLEHFKAGGRDPARAGPPREQGFARQDLVMGLGAIGLGGLAGSLWAEDPVRGAVLGALAGGVLSLPGVKGTLADSVKHIDSALGMVSTRLKNASPELHQRAITHEQQVLEQTHKSLNQGVRWMKASVNLPKQQRAALDNAIFMNDPVAIAQAHKGKPELVAGWRELRNELARLGKEAQNLGRFKEMLADYFPQRVKDYKGLRNALELPIRQRIEKLIEEAESRALARGAALTTVERDAIINRELRSAFRVPKQIPDYAKARKIKEVTERLQPFYHTPQEAFAITVEEIVKDLQLAKLFGRDLVQRTDKGRTYTDLTASVGNILGREMAEGRLTPEKFTEVQQILLDRFGPGERSPAKAIQNLQNLTYAGLLADLPSAVVQLGDTVLAVPAHGLRSTVIALARKLSGNKKIGVDDLYLMDHIAEDLAFGSTRIGSSRARIQASVAAGGVVGALAGAILGDDIKGALPGAAAGAFVGYASIVGTAAALNKTLRQGVFSPIDRFGKDIQLGAAHDKLTRWAQKKPERLENAYEAAFGSEFSALVADLRRGELTPRVRAALFAELSRTQPISKLEAPQLLLKHPNARIVWMLKRFMLKQADFIRREAYNEMRTGDPKRIARGMANLTEFTAVLGLSGASSAMLQDFILGREVNFEATDVMDNVLKTFGLSRYVMDKMQQGGVGPIQAIGGGLLPPYAVMDRIITADPKAVQYIPIVGQLYYNWELGGREKAELREARKAKKEGREKELSPRAERYRDRRREERRERRERESR